MCHPHAQTAESSSEFGRLIVVVGTLYITQGIPLGVSMVVIPTILRQNGASLDMIGFASLAMLPWAIKFLWAPLVDSRGFSRLGHRRTWILPLQTLLAVLMAVIGLFSSVGVEPWTLIGMASLANLVSATQDIATDGLAVDNLARPGMERPLAWANGFQVGGFAAGMCIGGPLMLIAQDWIGHQAAFFALGALLLVSLVPVLTWPEGIPIGDNPRHAGIRRFFKRRRPLVMLAVAALFNGQHMMVSTLTRPLLVDAGASATVIGLISGAAIILMAAGSGAVGGVLVSRFGIWLPAMVGLVAAWVGGAAWIAIARMGAVDISVVMSVTVWTGLFFGIAYVAIFALFMRWAAGDQSGTDFTILQCAESCGGIALGAIAGGVAERLGFEAALICAALIGLVGLVVIFGPGRRLGINASNEDEAEELLNSPA